MRSHDRRGAPESPRRPRRKQDAVLDARGVFDSVTADPIKPPSDRHLQLHAQALREYLDDGSVDRLYWFDTRAMLADGMTKGSVDREALIRVGERGEWHIEGDQPVKAGKESRASHSDVTAGEPGCGPTHE